MFLPLVSHCSRYFELLRFVSHQITQTHIKTGDAVSLTPYLLWRGRSAEHYLMFDLCGWSDAVFTRRPSPKTLQPPTRRPALLTSVAPLPTIPQIRGQSNLLHFYRIFDKTSARARFSCSPGGALRSERGAVRVREFPLRPIKPTKRNSLYCGDDTVSVLNQQPVVDLCNIHTLPLWFHSNLDMKGKLMGRPENRNTLKQEMKCVIGWPGHQLCL